jgi:molybdate transport system regulatory protein
MPAGLTPRVKVWLEIDGRYVFGLGISEILQAVQRTGSIKHAAAALGKSYRYVWGRVKKAERALGRPLVVTHVGGKGDQRSALTPVAHQYADAFVELRSRVSEFVRDQFIRRFRLPS